MEEVRQCTTFLYYQNKHHSIPGTYDLGLDKVIWIYMGETLIQTAF